MSIHLSASSPRSVVLISNLHGKAASSHAIHDIISIKSNELDRTKFIIQLQVYFRLPTMSWMSLEATLFVAIFSDKFQWQPLERDTLSCSLVKLIPAKSAFSELTNRLGFISLTVFTLCSLTWPQKKKNEKNNRPRSHCIVNVLIWDNYESLMPNLVISFSKKRKVSILIWKYINPPY